MKVVNKFTYLRIKLVRKGGPSLIFNSDGFKLRSISHEKFSDPSKMRKKCNQCNNYESTVVTNIITIRLTISSSQIKLILLMKFDTYVLDYRIILTDDHLIQKMPNVLGLLFKQLCLLIMQILYVQKVPNYFALLLKQFCLLSMPT